MRNILACLALLTATAAQAQTQPVDIGVNVGSVNDYAVQSFFVDAMKHARHWGTSGTPWDEAAAVDAQGWPTQDAGAVILCCVANATGHSLIAGTYQLTFQGQASVAFTVNGSGSVSGMAYNAATNTSTALVTLADSGAGSSLILSFTATQRSPAAPVGSGVTDVTLIRPRTAPNGHAWWTQPGQVFTTPYLNLLRRFTTLRFMDFTATNGVTLTSWSQRTTPRMATQQNQQGAAWEYVILLANTLHKDVWINIPDQADSDYVTQLATLLHTTLDPSLHVYVEYSNEVWNYSFGQAGRNQAAAEAIVATNPASPLAIGCADYASCRYEWGERLVGMNAVQDGAIFRTVFGSNAQAVRPVYATQLGQTYFVSLVFSMIQASMPNPVSSYLYAIAQAPYWTGDNSLTGLGAGQELANASANLATLAGPEHDFAVWATNYGLRSITYEGGPGMSGTASLSAKISANRNGAIGPLVAQSLRSAFASGTSLYMYYNDAGQYGQYGMWGLTENVFGTTPKLAAVAAVQHDGAEPLATGTKLPAIIKANPPDTCSGGEYVEPGYLYLGAGAVCGFLVNVPATATYAVTLSTGTYGTATQATLLVDQTPAASVVIPATGGNLSNWTSTSPAAVTLTAGLHVLSVSAVGTGFGVQTVGVQAQ